MPGYLPPGGYGDPSNNPDFDLTTRPAMFPFLGQYTNRDTGENQFGPAWPTAVTEPLNALMRLIQNSRFEDGRLGIPNPQNIENQHDVTTLIESLTGGNATRGMGAVERGAVEAAAPSSHGSVISGAGKGSGKYYSLLRDEPDLTVPSQAPFAGNEGINRLAYDILDRNGDDAGRAELAIDPSKGQAYIDNITLGGNQHGTAGMRDLINSLRALHPEIRSVYGDRTSGARAGSANPRQSIDLFSDQLPSLPGAVIAGAERNPTSAANHYNIHNPPRMPERPFEEDYPNGAQANDLGLLQFDMEGRPLQAQYVVGRNALGGPDRAFPSSQLDDLTEKLLGRSPQSVAPGDIPGIAAFGPGRTNQVGSAGNLYVDRTLPSPTRERALAHELGHALDHITNSETRVPPRVGAHGNETNLLNDEYGQIYHDLASPDDASRGEARAARDRISPANFGYPTDQHDAEYLAEAFRAYMTDPNYMKTVAPTAAARLRSYVNAHPDLSKIIQFNSDQLPSLWGSALAGQQNQPYPNSLFTY